VGRFWNTDGPKSFDAKEKAVSKFNQGDRVVTQWDVKGTLLRRVSRIDGIWDWRTDDGSDGTVGEDYIALLPEPATMGELIDQRIEKKFSEFLANLGTQRAREFAGLPAVDGTGWPGGFYAVQIKDDVHWRILWKDPISGRAWALATAVNGGVADAIVEALNERGTTYLERQSIMNGEPFSGN
jgi:hypothetical protein